MKRLILALLISLLFPLSVIAAPTCAVGTSGVAPTATISWTAPTLNTDGTPIATPLTYVLYQGTTSGAETALPTVISTSPITLTTGLSSGTTVYWYLVVKDANGTFSVPSNEVCKTFPPGVPKAVTITIS